MNTHQYFTITYDISKLSDDEQKQLFANAQSLFQSGKAISAGWADEGGDFHSNIDDGDVTCDYNLLINKGLSCIFVVVLCQT